MFADFTKIMNLYILTDTVNNRLFHVSGLTVCRNLKYDHGFVCLLDHGECDCVATLSAFEQVGCFLWTLVWISCQWRGGYEVEV